MPQSGQAAAAASGWARVATRSGAGRTCTTARPAGIRGRKRLDNQGFHGREDVFSSCAHPASQRLRDSTECAAEPGLPCRLTIANSPRDRHRWRGRNPLRHPDRSRWRTSPLLAIANRPSMAGFVVGWNWDCLIGCCATWPGCGAVLRAGDPNPAWASSTRSWSHASRFHANPADFAGPRGGVTPPRRCGSASAWRWLTPTAPGLPLPWRPRPPRSATRFPRWSEAPPPSKDAGKAEWPSLREAVLDGRTGTACSAFRAAKVPDTAWFSAAPAEGSCCA